MSSVVDVASAIIRVTLKQSPALAPPFLLAFV